MKLLNQISQSADMLRAHKVKPPYVAHVSKTVRDQALAEIFEATGAPYVPLPLYWRGIRIETSHG